MPVLLKCMLGLQYSVGQSLVVGVFGYIHSVCVLFPVSVYQENPHFRCCRDTSVQGGQLIPVVNIHSFSGRLFIL